ncbi:unnamed protein product, partial [Urochloa humidicola]
AAQSAATVAASGRAPRPRATLLPALLRRHPLHALPAGRRGCCRCAGPLLYLHGLCIQLLVIRLAYLHLIRELAHGNLACVFLCRLKNSPPTSPLFALKVIDLRDDAPSCVLLVL